MNVRRSDVTVDLRPLRNEDVTAVVALYNALSQEHYGEDSMTQSEFGVWLTSPNVDARRDIRVAFEGDRLVGYADVYDQNQWHTRYWCEVKARDEAVADALVGWCEGRASGDARDGAFLRSYVREREAATVSAFERRGYERIRSSFRMLLDLDDEPAPPEWPEGIAVRTIGEAEDRALYEADQECFADHWEHVEEPYDEWLHWTLGREGFDRSLVFVAADGDAIAGYALCRPSEAEPDTGWVDRLGVRRSWRKRGIALALLRHGFREFRNRGFRRAGLGVDAENLTGAVRLYERAGMRVARRSDCYQRTL